MLKTSLLQRTMILLVAGLIGYACEPAMAAVQIEGQVQAGGGPVAKSTVTLWAASAAAPQELAQAQTGTDGRFVVSIDETPSRDMSLYLVATGGEATVNKGSGDNPAIALLTVLGSTPPHLNAEEGRVSCALRAHSSYDAIIRHFHAMHLIQH